MSKQDNNAIQNFLDVYRSGTSKQQLGFLDTIAAEAGELLKDDPATLTRFNEHRAKLGAMIL